MLDNMLTKKIGRFIHNSARNAKKKLKQRQGK